MKPSMPSDARRKGRLAQEVTALLACALLTSSCERGSQPPTASQPTSRVSQRVAHFEVTWQDMRNGRPAREQSGEWHMHGELLLRSGAVGSSDLLLRDLTKDEILYRDYKTDTYEPPAPQAVCVTVFRYVPGATRLETLDVAAWDAATGDVSECGGQYVAKSVAPFRLRPLTFESQPIQLAGRHPSRITGLPELPYIAVVSADGEMEGLQIGFLGGQRPTGPYYLEIFSKTDGRKVGETIQLPFNKDTCVAEGPCWSSDGKFIVFASCYGAEELWVVQTGLGEGDQKHAEALIQYTPRHHAGAPVRRQLEFRQRTDW